MERNKNMEKNKTKSENIYVDVYLGAAPLLETRLVEGLLNFGRNHPRWRFSLRGANFRYTRTWLRKQRLDGVLALIDAKAIAENLYESGVPLVHLLPTRLNASFCVGVDDRAIGQLGAEFFLGKGFLKCAFCGVGMPWSRLRFTGFKECLEDSGRMCKFIDIPFRSSAQWELPEDSENILVDWLHGLEKGTAIMVAHDVLANRIVDLCVREGIRIPHDLSILGVGNHKLLCELSPIPISSIDAAVPAVAIQGAAMLERILLDGEQPQPILIPPNGIVERRSTEIITYGNDLVGKAVAYIHDHASEGIGVGDLMKNLSVSRRTLTRRFNRYVGHSPSEEIRRVRLRHARDLVVNSNLSLSEIASMCGYADLSHMTRAFRKHDGIAGGLKRLRGK